MKRLGRWTRPERAGKIAAQAALGLMLLTQWGCPFGPPIPVEEAPPNFPPFISEEFITPRDNRVTLSRSGPQVTFAVNQVFDINENERLELTWLSRFAPGGSGGVLSENFSGRDPNNPTLHRGIFHRYTGASYTLDPCDTQLWGDQQHHVLSVIVSDGALIIDETGQPQVAENAFMDVHSWTIEFVNECPEL